MIKRPSCSKSVSGNFNCHKSAHGVRSRVDRSTCAGVGSQDAGDSNCRKVTLPGTAGKSCGCKELNDERPDNKGLPVSDERVDTEKVAMVQ